MKELLQVVNDTFYKSSITEFHEYLSNYSSIHNYILASDYCINDSGKQNDIFSFVVLPQIGNFGLYSKLIKEILPNDIKSTRTVNPRVLEIIESDLVFIINFIFPKGEKRLLRNLPKKDIIESINMTISMINTWIKNEPEKKAYYESEIKKFTAFKNEAQKSSFNINLYVNALVLATLSGYLTHQIIKHSNAEEVIWFSDRDDMTTSNDGIIYNDYSIQYNGIQKNDNSCEKKAGHISIGITNTGEDCWYDEIIRIPDYFAGSYASFDFDNKSIEKEKHKTIVNISYKNVVNIIIQEEKKVDHVTFIASRLKVSRK